jgi:fibronectin type 3 domain-containing protein
VDAAANHHAINPNVYGVCFAGTADLAALNAPLNRDGGNNMSDYNWQIDALNLDNDWYFESFLQDSPITPGKAVDNFIQQTYAANVGSEPMVTIPMLPYIAKLGPNPTTSAASLWSYSVAKYGAQTGADPYQPDAGNGISAATGQRIVNDPNDAYVPNSVTIQQAWLQHILSTWGTSSTTNGIKYYILDNEPSLWNSTHVDVHPNPETYQEEYNNIVSYAAAIRAADPNAKIVAPEEWIWWAMFESGLDQKNGTGPGSDYATHNDTYYYPWLLQQLYTYQQTSGTKLIDALSVHCYNPIPGGSDDSASGQATRNQETRILWDPNFVDPSWEGTLGINGGIQNWIPTIRNWVNQYYPGLEIGCTEYNWGDETALNGATAQADVLGLYGAYGLDFATRWTVPAYPTYLAMQIYRNYDGKLSTFGDTGVSATVADPDNLSAFAAVRSSDGALTVMVINKQQGSTPVTVSLANFGTTGTAQAWQIASASQTSITSLGSVPVTSNAVSMTVPSQSITLFVIPAGSVTSPPNAPTGLAATVGSGTVTLTWVASGGATSYSVKRGTVSGGPYVTLGTVPDTSALSYTDTGLTNGTTYYYVVSATNSAGTSPNSAELAVTPIVPPTFTSSASASPNPVTQGTSTTISATVTCNANTLTNGIVQIYVVDPNGNVAATQNFTGQNLTANQSHPYTLALTPAVAGTYTVELGVFSATWQNWYWNSSAASITVNSSTVFTSSVTAPSTVALGGTATIGLTVKETGRGDLTNGNVELQIFSASGSAVATNVWSGQNFAAGQTNTYSYTWSPVSGTVAPGTYAIDVGVFNSSWSVDYYWNTDATITVTTGTSPPPAPTGLTATAGNAQVSLSWTASTGATSYNVYRGTSAGGESPTPIATSVTATSYLNTGLTNGTTYYYKVAAVNSAGTSALSAEVSATPKVSPPPAPTGLTATAGNAQVSLSWTASAGAASYNVYRGTSAGGENSKPVATGLTATSYVNTGLINGRTYYYKVAAVNAGGTSPLSNEASATPKRR